MSHSYGDRPVIDELSLTVSRSERAEAVPPANLGLLPGSDLDRPVGALSIGQQRRLALALILAKPPHLFLLDEPTNHLSLRLRPSWRRRWAHIRGP